MTARKPVFAGSWYPADADECRRQIQSFLKESRFVAETSADVSAGIVPHAGWFFSGDLACRVISLMRGDDSTPQPDVVVVFGMHLPPSAQPYMMPQGEWETPLGSLEIASDLAAKLSEDFSFHMETPADFTPDNTIELQLPFIKHFFSDAKLLPIGVPPSATGIDIGRAAVKHAGELGLSLKIIGSTDLTHYGPNFGLTQAGTGRKAYEWVKNQNDRQVIDQMLAMAPEEVIRQGLSKHNACCAGAAAAAISAAKQMGVKEAALVGYSSSYEKNPGSSFVGYGGIVYTS